MFIAFKLIFKHRECIGFICFKTKVVRLRSVHYDYYFNVFFPPLHTHIFVRWLHLHFGFYSTLLIETKWNERSTNGETKSEKKKKLTKMGKCLWLFIIAKNLIRIGWLSRSQLISFFPTLKQKIIWSLRFSLLLLLLFLLLLCLHLFFIFFHFFNEWMEMELEMSSGSGHLDIIKFCIGWFLLFFFFF